MIALMIKNHTNLNVETKLNLGTTAIAQNALLKGEIDLYPEYTGTAYLTVLHKKYNPNLSTQAMFNTLKADYQKQFNLTWLPPFGFNNSQTIAIPKALAQKLNISNLSQLAPYLNQITLAAPPEFLERADGLKGLEKAYQLKFTHIRQMTPDLMYAALASKQVNAILAFTTDGRLQSHNLQLLDDNKHFYPPYDAAIIIREQTLKQHPEIYCALKPLFNRLNNKTMQTLNNQVDSLHKTPYEVAKNYLKTNRLLSRDLSCTNN
ncbi:glycine betaine ABC transporter substrate-binding protein [Piscirickettsia litoralis]|uniref:glycine betaine ABC transporter substrate-binding protein n=1 Tax=Piscirickettsia litoralis TaxID=1891921 RepID=UPI001F2C808D|nr:glycine betaine ABC transporter substrate-binding protein [Piscirickettsia litoralis]